MELGRDHDEAIGARKGLEPCWTNITVGRTTGRVSQHTSRPCSLHLGVCAAGNSDRSLGVAKAARFGFPRGVNGNTFRPYQPDQMLLLPRIFGSGFRKGTWT